MFNVMAHPEDIVVRCFSCKNKVNVHIKTGHQLHHNALKTLKYKPGKVPASVDVLLKRRRLLMKKLITKYNENPTNSDLLQRLAGVNEAFDIVRSHLLRGGSVSHSLTPFLERISVKEGGHAVDDKDVLEDIKSTATMDKLPDCVIAIGTSCATNLQYRDVMEDRTCVQEDFVSLEKNAEGRCSCFVGVYDGYGGSAAAEQTHHSLHKLLRNEIEKEKAPINFVENLYRADTSDLPDAMQQGMLTQDAEEEGASKTFSNFLSSQAVLKSCRRAFKTMDGQLSWGVNETSRVRWSGCSTTVCIITDEKDNSSEENKQTDDRCNDGKKVQEKSAIGKIFVSNLGNVEAYLSHNKKPVKLTQCHSTCNAEEKQRVTEAGGKIVGNTNRLTVNGVLATTRGLGNHGDVALRKCVTSVPHGCTARILSNTQFVVIATSSIWNIFDAEEIFYIIKNTPKFLKHMDELKAKLNASERCSTGLGYNLLDDEVFAPVDKPTNRVALSIIHEKDELHHQEGIEEVVIVERRKVEYDDDESTIEPDDYTRSERGGVSEDPRLPPAEDEMTPEAAYRRRLAGVMSERLVKAALTAGTIENVSAVVILFKGYFE